MTSLPANLAFESQTAGSWLVESFQLVSLLEMLEFSAVKYVEMVVALERLTSIFNVDVEIHTPFVTGEGKERITGPLNDFTENCKNMGLKTSAAFALQIVEKVNSNVSILESLGTRQSDKSLSPQDLNTEISALRRIFYSELAGYDFMTVLPAKRDYYNKPLELFWKDGVRYDSAAVDVENAGKCFALNRHTACVFHLMRVMETGLRLLVTSLGYALPKHNRSWHVILHRHLKDLHEPQPENRSPEWNANPEFYAEAAARLLAVKDAWRNKTMHVEINYDEDQAKDIWSHVSGFMRHLTTIIPE